MNLDVIYRKSEDIASRTVDGEAVLVTASEGSVTILNEVGSFLWDAIDGHKTYGMIVDLLLKNFNIDKDTALGDSEEFFTDLLNKDFIRNG